MDAGEITGKLNPDRMALEINSRELFHFTQLEFFLFQLN